jgi:hypothetical protein
MEKKEDDEEEIIFRNNPIAVVKELRQELEIERRLRYAGENFQRVIVEKREDLNKKLAEYETEKHKTQKDLNILASQLNRHGLEALRYIPLEEIRSEMQAIFNHMNQGGTYDERRLDYLLACLEINPDYIKEKEHATKKWIKGIQSFLDDCHVIMMGFIPPNIFQITLIEMVEEGLPKTLANRFKNKQCLWLIRLERNDLQKLHEAELLGRFNPEGQNLDIVELAAIYASFPETFLNDPFQKKQRWKERIETLLKQMIADKDNGKLSKAKQRFAGYHNVTAPYVGRVTLHTLNAIKAADNIG